MFVGQGLGQYVDSLCYKPETRGFVSLPVCYWYFHLLNPSGRTLTQSVHILTRFGGGHYRHHGIHLAS